MLSKREHGEQAVINHVREHQQMVRERWLARQGVPATSTLAVDGPLKLVRIISCQAE